MGQLLVVELFSHFKQPVNESVEDEDDVGVKILDHMNGTLSISLLIFGNEVDLIFLQILPKYDRFLKMTIIGNLLLEFQNQGFLFF